jgi:hypothetical protein
LSGAWVAWVVENSALGAPREPLVAALCAAGVPERVARREVDAIRRRPAMGGALRVGQRVQRHELYSRLRRELASLAREPREVERRARLSADEFFDRYYAGNVPVVVTDALETWPNLARWSPAYFAEAFGDAEVEVMTGRDADPVCDANFEAYSSKTTLGAFCDRVASAGTTNDIYLVANNRATNRPALAALLADVAAPHPYLEPGRDASWTSLWFGPPGTVTPLHHDTANVLFCQVYGRKRIVLVPPFELSLMEGMHHGVYSAAAANETVRRGAAADETVAPSAGASVDSGELAYREVTLAPGEGLFLPVGWWHRVRALDVSISLAFTAFRRPNQFDWYYPGKIGMRR